MSNEIDKQLTCTMCRTRVETYSEIVYSQGDRVCLDCKEKTQAGDNAAFDRDWHSTHADPWNVS